jgi:hypothetical protein
MNDMTRYQEIAAWDMYACAALTMALHPGSSRDGAVPPSIEDVAWVADQMMVERKKRFNETSG